MTKLNLIKTVLANQEKISKWSRNVIQSDSNNLDLLAKHIDARVNRFMVNIED